MHLSLIDPDTHVSFPHVQHGGRTCYAVPAGARFAVRVDVSASGFAIRERGRVEHVVAVDGRDTLTNDDASARADGIISDATYVCRGFRTGNDGVREFVCAELGHGTTTAERNGTTGCAGLVSAVAYLERRPSPPPPPTAGRMSRSITGQKSIYSVQGFSGAAGMLACSSASSSTSMMQAAAGPSVGTAAGAFVAAPTHQVDWKRGEEIARVVIEYDTREGWAARGMVFPTTMVVLARDPWPADAAKVRHCDPVTL